MPEPGNIEVRDELARMLRALVTNPALDLPPDLKLGENIRGWDSFKMVQLLVEAQDLFGVELRARQIDGIETFGDLVASFENAMGRPDERLARPTQARP
jgi:acyl carrier protein